MLGWGVGGIEAEAAMLGQALSMLIPDVVGVQIIGTLPAGATATEVVSVASPISEVTFGSSSAATEVLAAVASMSLADLGLAFGGGLAFRVRNTRCGMMVQTKG